MRLLSKLVLVILIVATPIPCEETWDWWYTCNHGFMHYYKRTGITDPRLGEIIAEKLACLRPNCGWHFSGNDVNCLGAELSHWKFHVPDKKEQKKQRKHYSVDGPHYAAVEGQPTNANPPSRTQEPH